MRSSVSSKIDEFSHLTLPDIDVGGLVQLGEVAKSMVVRGVDPANAAPADLHKQEIEAQVRCGCENR